MKLYFLIVVIFIFIYTQRNLIEPIIGSCCGGMNMHRGDYKETDTEPPKRWKRCFKPNEWDSFPCTNKESSKCCGGIGKCRPTKYGGKCEKDDSSAEEKFFIYEGGIENDYSHEDERKDAKDYTAEEDEERSFDCISIEGTNTFSSTILRTLVCVPVSTLHVFTHARTHWFFQMKL